MEFICVYATPDHAGILMWPNGKKYDGHFSDNMMHGKGTFCPGNGERIEGTWERDLQQGPGLIYDADDNVTEGEWIDNVCTTKNKLEKNKQSSSQKPRGNEFDWHKLVESPSLEVVLVIFWFHVWKFMLFMCNFVCLKLQERRTKEKRGGRLSIVITSGFRNAQMRCISLPNSSRVSVPRKILNSGMRCADSSAPPLPTSKALRRMCRREPYESSRTRPRG